MDRIAALDEHERRARDEQLQEYRKKLPKLEPGEQPDPQVLQELQPLQAALRGALDRLTAQTEAAALKVLTAEQRRRFAGIQLQAEGPLAFTHPEIHQRLNLSPDQVEAIGEIVA